jgi:AcrR family transcriptional regulator
MSQSAGSGGSTKRIAGRPAADGRQQILDAAARLFAKNGFAATTTRAIALAVGIKQASIYYHFDNKQDILAGMLSETVRPSLEFAAQLTRSDAPPHVQLYALSYFDVSLLSEGPANVGALYHLPEVRSERFEEFRRDRDLLRDEYGTRISAGYAAGTFGESAAPAVTTDLVFAFAESVISLRARDAQDLSQIPSIIAAGCLRLLSCGSADILHAEVAARELLAAGFREADRTGHGPLRGHAVAARP